jgi:hypothetical protein
LEFDHCGQRWNASREVRPTTFIPDFVHWHVLLLRRRNGTVGYLCDPEEHYSWSGCCSVPICILWQVNVDDETKSLHTGFYCVALNTLPYPYTAEILPFALRAKGLALFVCVQNVAISFNQFVTPIALEVSETPYGVQVILADDQKIQWRYYAVFLVTLAFYICLALFFYRETKGLSLEEAAMVYDFKRSEARAQIKEMFKEEDKPEVKHIEDEDERKDAATGLR